MNKKSRFIIEDSRYLYGFADFTNAAGSVVNLVGETPLPQSTEGGRKEVTHILPLIRIGDQEGTWQALYRYGYSVFTLVGFCWGNPPARVVPGAGTRHEVFDHIICDSEKTKKLFEDIFKRERCSPSQVC